MDVGMEEAVAADAVAAATASPPAPETSRYTRNNVDQLHSMEDTGRSTKRQRLNTRDQGSSVKGEKLEQELGTLRIRGGAHDHDLTSLKRRLELAIASERLALDEINAVTSRYAEEKLALQKTAARLQTDVQVVEQSMAEWRQRALDCEAQLRALKRQSQLEIQLLQDELAAAGGSKDVRSTLDGLTTPADHDTQLERALAVAEARNTKLTRHLEAAEKQLAEYERRLGRGEFNAKTTKIVHLAVNPTSELLQTRQDAVHEQLEALKKENEALRAQFEKLSGTSLSPIKCTPMSAAPKQKQPLTTTTSYETVEGLKMLNKRLKEVFAEQTQHYREAVYLLTGYKVDLRKSNGVEMLRLRSVYAEHSSDELLVKMEPSGALELLDTDFCAHISQGTLAYMTMCRSFPAFLAALTLQLFEKQTFQG